MDECEYDDLNETDSPAVDVRPEPGWRSSWTRALLECA
jgi:hypothetical protein